MTIANNLLHQTWDQVSTALNGIFQLQSMNSNEYMALFNLVYRYQTSSQCDDAFLSASANKNTDKMETDEEERIIPGGELYFNTKKFFKNHLENIAANGNNLEGEAFLRFYAKTWEQYQFSSSIANGILSVVNQNWVSRKRTDGIKDIYDIYTVAMHIWQDIFFKDSTQSLTQTCLKLINEERNGILVDSRLIGQVVQSYVAAGFKSEQSNSKSQSIEKSLTTYVDYFEKSFIEETTQFYKIEGQRLIDENSINDYIKKVNQRLSEEENRVKTILHLTTLEKIKPLLEDVLIVNQLKSIYEQAIILLHNEKLEDLRLVFNLVNRIPHGNEPLEKELEESVLKIGLDAINSQSAAAIKDPKLYIETIIQVYQRFSKIVSEGFCDYHGYKIALDKAFKKIVNDNAVTTAAGTSKRSSELLAAYCDILLRKGSKATEQTDLEEKLNQIMVVFNYIEDKDAFQKFYGKRLAKRLVGELSASDDYEESMISKLKEACGFEYTSRLQRMFQDIGVSKHLIEQYRTYCEDKKVDNIVSLSVMVLGSNAWPFFAPPNFVLPIELKRTFESFTNFYTRQHNGRKLTWLHQHSKGDLQTLYTKPKYTFQVSIYQMTVLLLFNRYDNLRVEEIKEKTEIDNELFLPVLLTLLKSKVLISSNIDSKELDDDKFDEKNIKSEYTIKVDETYKSKNIRRNLNVPLKSVEQKESEKDNKSVDEDRKLVIQAYIVRIMKTRKELKHALLMQEVIDQLKSRFLPKIPLIKTCIDILIEKEYLERHAQKRDELRYLA